jgi:hypothetical protein
METALDIWMFLENTFGAAAASQPAKVKREFDLASTFPIDDKTKLAQKTYTDWLLHLVMCRSKCVKAGQAAHVTPDIMIQKIVEATQYHMADVARDIATRFMVPGVVQTEAILSTVIGLVNRQDGFSSAYKSHLESKKPTPTVNTILPGTSQTVPQPDRKKKKFDKKRKSDATTPDSNKKGKDAGTPTTPRKSSQPCDICKRVGRDKTCLTCSNCKGHGHFRHDCVTPSDGSKPAVVNAIGVGSSMSGDT